MASTRRTPRSTVATRVAKSPYGAGQGGGLMRQPPAAPAAPAAPGGMKQASPNPGRTPGSGSNLPSQRPTGMKQASPNPGRTPRPAGTPAPSGGRTAKTGGSARRVSPDHGPDLTHSDLSFKPVGPYQARSSSKRTLGKPPAGLAAAGRRHAKRRALAKKKG